MRTWLTFDDVLILPGESSVLPAEANPQIQLCGLELSLPFLSAAMDTITEAPMAIAMARCGGLGIIHRNMDVKEQIHHLKQVKEASTVEEEGMFKPCLDRKGERLAVGVAISAGEQEVGRAVMLVDQAEADVVVVDTAHGHSKRVLDTVEMLKKQRPSLPVIAGNIATLAAAKALVERGADVLKVGIGGGSICTTRIVTGVGAPQLSAIMEIAPYAKKQNIPLIADGGIRHSGDVGKAIAGGARAVMMGSTLSSTKEAPGEVVKLEDGRRYKAYRGMGSLGALSGSTGHSRYGNALPLQVPEGVEAHTFYKGAVRGVLEHFTGALCSTMGYVGASTIQELWEKAEMIRVSSAAFREGHVHDVIYDEKTLEDITARKES